MAENAEKCVQKNCTTQLINLKKVKLAAKSCLKNCHLNQKCMDKCISTNEEDVAKQLNQCIV